MSKTYKICIVIPDSGANERTLSDNEFKIRVHDTMLDVANLYTGCTVYRTFGGWRGSSGKWFAENGSVLTSLVTGKQDTIKHSIRELCKGYKLAWSQQEVMFWIENAPHMEMVS